jgi:phosphatidylglycerol---prolipoprotein diacylglyceryl transferase
VITYNIDPVLLRLGPISIYYYSLVYVFGLLFVYWLLYRKAKKKEIKNLTTAGVDDLVLYIAIGLIVGGRLMDFVFYRPMTLFSDPLELFKLWHGGMSFHGGLIGIMLGTWLFCRKHKVRFYDIADNLVIPAALILVFGRIANFINGELIGTVTKVPWCVNYPGVEGCRHPSQFYEAGKNLVIFFVLLGVRAKKKLKSGVLFWLFVMMYGALRFLVNLFRDDPKYLGISTGQYLSLMMVAVAGVFLWKILRTEKKSE